ncbi:MAG: hypothetical protein WCK59_02060 [Candidatus Falkowbacteria bacterium]
MSHLKYYFEWFFYSLFFSGVAIIQAAFISALPPVYAAINLPLTCLLFSLLVFNKEKTLVFAILIGFWLDILNFNFFGLNILIFLATFFIIDFLLNNWLTNRSLYSFLVLSSLSVVIYNILLYLFLAISHSGQAGFSFFLFQSSFWIQLGWQIIWGGIFMLLFFNVANFLSRRLKPFFLENK